MITFLQRTRVELLLIAFNYPPKIWSYCNELLKPGYFLIPLMLGKTIIHLIDSVSVGRAFNQQLRVSGFVPCSAIKSWAFLKNFSSVIILIFFVLEKNVVGTGRSIVLSTNKLKKLYVLKNSKFLYDTKEICDKNKNITNQIKFHIICGSELQKPHITKHICVTSVLIIDPEICEEKVCSNWVLVILFNDSI